MIAALLLLSLAAPQTYVSEECAFRFEVPAGWEVAPRDFWIEPHCAVVLRPAGKKRVPARRDVDAVIVATMSGPFDEAAWAANFLRRDDGTWALLARSAARRTTTVRNEQWRGLRGSSDLGCHGERAALENLCFVHRVALQAPGDRGRILIMKSYQPGKKILDPIIATFAFTGPAPECEERPANVVCLTARLDVVERELDALLPDVEEQRRWRKERGEQCARIVDEVARDRCREIWIWERIEELKTR